MLLTMVSLEHNCLTNPVGPAVYEECRKNQLGKYNCNKIDPHPLFYSMQVII